MLTSEQTQNIELSQHVTQTAPPTNVEAATTINQSNYQTPNYPQTPYMHHPNYAQPVNTVSGPHSNNYPPPVYISKINRPMNQVSARNRKKMLCFIITASVLFVSGVIFALVFIIKNAVSIDNEFENFDNFEFSNCQN